MVSSIILFGSSVEYRAEVSACGFVTREVLIACRSFLIFVSVCWSVLHKPHFDLVGMCSFQFVPIGELGLGCVSDNCSFY